MTEKDRKYLRNHFTEHAFSPDIREAGPFDGTNRKLGCFIGVTESLKLKQSDVLRRTPFPDRTIVAKIEGSGIAFTAVCFHSLTGVGYKKTKSAQYTGIAEYLAAHKDEPMICCFDANEPEVDHYNLENVKFFNQRGDRGTGAALLMGADPVHNMQDTYRVFLKKNPTVLHEIQQQQDQTTDEKALKYLPLTTSHILRGPIS
ncbi:hypothetical protein [Oceanobacillus halotolerans]|uniref:hypothetical protein n=1 Tax=Oceanobacillus halotolerans TaxID=2663380 RepID=UPI0013D971C5|nr:hypothetical protein [Oceanobacillus halotolerans]